MDKIKIPLEELNLSVRTYMVLKNGAPSIDYVEDLLDLGLENILKIKNMGMKNIKEIYEKLIDLKVMKEEIDYEEIDYEEIDKKLKSYRLEEKIKREEKERIKVLLNPCRACNDEKAYLTCNITNKDICKSCCIKIQLNIRDGYLKDILKEKDDTFILNQCIDCMGMLQKNDIHTIKKAEDIWNTYKRRNFKSNMYKLIYPVSSNNKEGYFIIGNTFDNVLIKYLKLGETLKIPNDQLYVSIGENIKKDPVNAVKYYMKSYEMNPSTETGKKIGDCLIKLRNYKESIKWYKNSMSLDPRVYLNIAICYKNLSTMTKDKDQKIENLKLGKKYYLKTKPMYDQSEYLYYRSLGDFCKEIAILSDSYEYYEKAASYYETSVNTNNDKVYFQYEYDYILEKYSLVYCYMKIRRYEKAIKHAKQYLYYHPYESVEDIGKVDRSFVIIGDTEEIINRTGVMNMIMAKCYYQTHELDKAYDHIKIAMHFKPEDREMIDFCHLILQEKMYESYNGLSNDVSNIDQRIENKLNDYMDMLLEDFENKNIHLEQKIEKVQEDVWDLKEKQTYMFEKLQNTFIKATEEVGSIQENIEKLSNNMHHIFKQEGYYEWISWEEGDRLLKEYLGEKLYDEVSKYEEVIKPLKTAEWVWHNNIKNTENQLKNESIKDLTFLVVLHFKAMEIYLFERIFELGMGRDILLLRGESVEICDENKEYIHENSTIGNYFHFIKNNAQIMLKDYRKSLEVFHYIKDWSDHCRNSNLHKDIIESFSEVNKKRAETKGLFRKLMNDLR